MTFFNVMNGDYVLEMKRTDPRHRDEEGRQGLPFEKQEGFAPMLAGALDRISDSQLGAEALFEQMITHPDAVEPHDVSIAMARAEMSLNMAKSVIDKAVKAYNDIITLR